MLQIFLDVLKYIWWSFQSEFLFMVESQLNSLFVLFQIQEEFYQKSVLGGPVTEELSNSLVFLDELTMHCS